MKNIGVCRECQDRKRIVTEEEIYDCHEHCQKYKEAVEQENERQKRIIEADRGFVEHLRYMSADKERRRKHGL